MRNRYWIGPQEPSEPWLHEEMKDLFEGPSILLVEDDNDIRELLITLLRLAGFTPTACGSAEQALEQLREQPFDLILTDYALPNRSGGWLLQQAGDEGLLDATPALMITAHPNPPDVHGVEIIQKPFDLDRLVDRVQRRLEAGGTARPRRATKSGSPESGNGNHDQDCPAPVELILYVSAHSARSATAIRNIRQALEGQRAGRVTLTICDLSKDPELGQRDAVAFTPTLVKRSPGPRTFILGHITSPELVLELLDGCEDES
jgi:CheY-like chemotaxis protein